jgi:hypothetical protein
VPDAVAESDPDGVCDGDGSAEFVGDCDVEGARVPLSVGVDESERASRPPPPDARAERARARARVGPPPYALCRRRPPSEALALT